jgi:signal transduction histidine kinase/ActR/RegA family two-component response regulator/HPt (histidine-containing phosphotransfer) domain-containing protein
MLVLLVSASASLSKTYPEIFVPVGDRWQSLNAKIYYLDDALGQYSIEDVESGRAGIFKLFDVSTHSYDYVRKVIWIRFSVDLKNYEEPYWFLTQNYEHVGNIQLFYPTRNGRDALQIEEADPIEDRLFKIRNYLFKIPVSPNFPATYYMRVEPRGHWLSIDLSWSSTKGILEHIHHSQLFFGLFFGGLLVMWFYNFVLYFYLRDRSYFYYVYYLGCFIATFSYMNGFVPFFLQWTPFSEKIFAACTYGFLHGSILFARQFLTLKESTPKLDLYLRFWQFVLFVGGGTAFILPVGRPYQLVIYLVLFVAPVLFVAGFIRWRQGYEPARLYCTGWALFAVAMLLLALRTIGAIPSTFITNYSIQVASVWEAVLFSLALAYRIKLAEREKSAILEEHTKRELKILEDERAQLEQRVAERTESLQASLESRRMMLANASHELRTPVNALRLLLDSEPNHADAETTIIPSVSTIANHMSQLVENLLLLDDGSRSAQRGPIQEFDLGDELRATAAMLGPLRHGSAARFDLDVNACKGVMVRGDLTSLRRVVINLLSNAFKFTEHGAVSLTASVADASEGRKRECIIRVNDSGVGISTLMHEQIFGAFVTSGGPGGHTGTGLGLAISRQLAVNMSGSLTLVGSAPGVGSEFKFLACFDALSSLASDSVEVTSAPGQQVSSARRLNVLVAEDDPITAQAVLLIVLQLRHDVTHVGTYDELCEALQRTGPAYDIALIDHRLPGGNGLQAIREYQTACRESSTRMILVTADVTPEVMETARSLCDEVVTKPTTAHVLRQLLGEGPPTLYPPPDMREVVDAGPLKMLDQCGAEYQALIRMCATFNKTVGDTLIEIESRLAGLGEKFQNSPDLENIIHRIRGSCATIGATALAEDFKNLAVCDNLMAAQRQYALMVSTFHRTRKALHALLVTMRAA